LRSNVLFVLSFVSLLLLCNCGGAGSEANSRLILPVGTTATISVLGTALSFEDENWKDPRIGFGLQAQLIDLLYTSHLFRMLEENATIVAERKEILKSHWTQAQMVDFSVLPTTADYAAWAQIIYLGRPTEELSVGIVHRRSSKSIVRIELCIQARKSMIKSCATGDGEVSTIAQSVLFSFDADRFGSEQTEGSRAAQAALQNAFQKLTGR
jgi:hypothetical protein